MITATQLRRAADIQDKIESLQKKLAEILNDSGSIAWNGSKADGKAPRKKWKMSAASRAKIAAAQKARWAKHRAGKK